jgi:hypothetical protein
MILNLLCGLSGMTMYTYTLWETLRRFLIVCLDLCLTAMQKTQTNLVNQSNQM